ncbi:peptidase [Spirochaetia bacterium]|nr:peptidase [Spirochaetia bacterium]
MYQDRIALYKTLEENRQSRVLVYVTGDRRGLETSIGSDVYDYFVNQLDTIGVTPKISLYLYTRGGDTLAAWSIINLIKQFADEVEVIVPSKCHSAGTLMCLGAKQIIMTKQATLGPIDPSVNHPLNPSIPGAPPDAKIPVSVEAIEGYIQLIKEECGFNQKHDSNKLIEILTHAIHPIVLGQVYRTKAQIKMLSSRLLSDQIQDKQKIEKIISFLCSGSGSHDYVIHRREAREGLGLNIIKPDDNLYNLIKAIYDDIEGELELTSALNPNNVLGSNPQAQYVYKRALIESIDGGSYYFSSEGILTRQMIQVQPGLLQAAINDQRTFEGWKK